MNMTCQHCGAELPDDPHDTTYCNYDSVRYTKGTHTGNIYQCVECGEHTIELVQENCALDAWYY